MIEDKLDKGKGLIGMPCPQCGKPLWPEIGRYGAYMECTGHCGYTRNITNNDATTIARINGINCGLCGGQVVGRKGYSGIFLGCSNYPECRWTKPIEDII
jgi:ssDNA-binding Zn-finger/Zn-ribbon topoisomerase 1